MAYGRTVEATVASIERGDHRSRSLRRSRASTTNAQAFYRPRRSIQSAKGCFDILQRHRARYRHTNRRDPIANAGDWSVCASVPASALAAIAPKLTTKSGRHLRLVFVSNSLVVDDGMFVLPAKEATYPSNDRAQ
jgi:hypothetical protein